MEEEKYDKTKTTTKEPEAPKEAPVDSSKESEAAKEPAKEEAPKSKDAKEPKQKGSFLPIIFAVVGVAAVAGIVVLILNLTGAMGSGSPYKHSAYFVPENSKTDAKFALVNKDGEKLTEFTITKHESFIDGYALVRTGDGWGLMGEDGKFSVEPGTYDGLTRVGGLYSAMKAGEGHRLIHGSGKVVTEFDNEKNTKLGDASYNNENALVVAINRDEKKYELFNVHGKSMGTIESDDAPTIGYYTKEGPTESVTSISYSGGLIVISNDNMKELVRSTDAKKKYTISGSSYDRKLLALSHRLDKADSDTDSSYERAIIWDGKYIDLDKKCQSLSILNSSETNLGYVSCYTKDGSGFINDQGEFLQSYDSSTYRTTRAAVDLTHYASIDRDKKTVTINDKTIESASSITASGAHYMVNVDGKYSLYTKEGEQYCSLPEGASSFQGFNENDVAVSGSYRSTYTSKDKDNNDDEKTGYYLIDKDCNRISERYNSVTALGKHYSISKYVPGEDGKYGHYDYGLMNDKGEVKVNFGDYKRFSRVTYQGNAKNLIVATKEDNKYVLLNSDLEKIADLDSFPSYDRSQDIIKAKVDKVTKYFTSEGKEFFSVSLDDGASNKS